MRGIGYLRVSTSAQVSTGHGLTARRSAIEAEALCRGWQVTWVEDPGASGASLERPGAQYALDLLLRGQADALIVSKLFRLSLSLIDFATVVEVARDQRWRHALLDQPVDMTTEMGEVLAGIMAVFAQWERCMMSRRTREALAAADSRGVQVGRPRNTPDSTIDLIAGLCADGLTLTAIAERLNADGVPTARGGQRWWPSSVRAALLHAARSL